MALELRQQLKLAQKLVVVQKHTRNLKFGSKSDASMQCLEKKMTVNQQERLTKVLSLVKKKTSPIMMWFSVLFTEPKKAPLSSFNAVSDNCFAAAAMR